MTYSTIFIDLDDTLYPNTNGLWTSIRQRMEEFMQQHLDLPLDEVHRLRRHYFETYGTTLRGLQLHHQIDPYEFLDYVHDLPLDQYLAHDPSLFSLINSLPQQKWIFTNADEGHARRVLRVLELTDCFAGIIDVRALNFVCKPQSDAYQQAMSISGEFDPSRCVMLDDSIRNLVPATEIGFTSILVGSKILNPAAHYTIPSIHQLPRVMPELWEISHNESGL